MELGVHIAYRSGHGRIRVVKRSRWRVGGVEAMEVEFDTPPSVDALTPVRERFGVASSIAVAVDSEGLFVKPLVLPPLSPTDKRHIVMTEPERFFPVRGDDLVACVRGDDNLAFAIRTDELGAWIAALESLGPVVRVEPAPYVYERVVTASGISRATIVSRSSDGEVTTMMSVIDGRLRTVRKILGDASLVSAILRDDNEWPRQVYLVPWSDSDAGQIASAVAGSNAERLPTRDGVLDSYVCAYGITGQRNMVEPARDLMPENARQREAIRRRMRGFRAVVAAAIAIVFAVGSADYHRARTASWLQREVTATREQAAISLALRDELSMLQTAAAGLAEVSATRPDPLQVLQTLSELLPPDVSVYAVRHEGNDWEFDGYARDAAQLVPLLEEYVLFEDVRFRTATSRTQFEGEIYESFSLALRYIPAS